MLRSLLIVLVVACACGSAEKLPDPVPPTGIDASTSLDAGTPLDAGPLPWCCNAYCNANPSNITTDPLCVARPWDDLCSGDSAICVYDCNKVNGVMTGLGWEHCTSDGVSPGTTGPYTCRCTHGDRHHAGVRNPSPPPRVRIRVPIFFVQPIFHDIPACNC